MTKTKTERIPVRGSEITPGDIFGGRIVHTASGGVVTYTDVPGLRAVVAPAGRYVVERPVVSTPRKRRARANTDAVRADAEGGAS